MKVAYRKYIPILLLLICLVLAACQQPKPAPVVKKKIPASFKSVRNIRYTEARRYFSNGYSLTTKGYVLEPNWRLSFVSEDSVNIYNPKRKMFVNAPLILDHDSVFNIAWAYMRLKKLSKDSIIFQVLRVNGRVIDNDGSDVYMKLYADDYIRNVLHLDPLHMPTASHKDTLLLRQLTEKARKDPSAAFAAREIVQITSKTPAVKVIQIHNDDRSENERLTTDSPPIEYLSPEYEITVQHAYDDFSYYFTIYVDENGGMTYGKYMIPLDPPFSETYPAVVKKLIDGYMKAYLKVIPGSTYGIRHASQVIIRLNGIK